MRMCVCVCVFDSMCEKAILKARMLYIYIIYIIYIYIYILVYQI